MSVAMVLRPRRPRGMTIALCLMLVCLFVSMHAQAESSGKDAPTDVAPAEASDRDRGALQNISRSDPALIEMSNDVQDQIAKGKQHLKWDPSDAQTDGGARTHCHMRS